MGEHLLLQEPQTNVKQSVWSQIFGAVAVCYVSLCGGNILGFTSSAIPSIRNSPQPLYLNNDTLEDFNYLNATLDDGEEWWNLSDEEASWISGLSPLGAGVGSLIGTIPMNVFGPRGSILFIGGPILLGSWILTAIAPSLVILWIARFMGGVGMGLSMTSGPVWIVDSVSLNLRGALGTLPQVFLTFGILVSFVLGAFLDWRGMAIGSSILVLPIFLLLAYTPESPIWLAKEIKRKNSSESFKCLHGRLHHQSQDINENIQNNSKKIFDEKGGIAKPIIVAFSLMAFQQLCGISGVNFYALTIFSSSGSSIQSEVAAITIAATNFLVSSSSAILIEKLGRKILMCTSMGLLAVSSGSLGIFFHFQGRGSEEYSWVPLAALGTFVFAFSAGYGPVTWILCAEILPGRIRHIVSPITVAVNWFFVFLVAKTFPGLVREIGTDGTFGVYSVLSTVGLVFTLFAVPETRGKSEREIQKLFYPKRRSEEIEVLNRLT